MTETNPSVDARRSAGGAGEGHSWVSRGAVAAGAFVLFAVFSEGGLVTRSPWGDVGHYETFARRILEGEIPYHDFSMEYPPFALPVFLAPALLTDAPSDYLQVFKASMALCGVLMVFAISWALSRLRAPASNVALALGTVALSPLLLGHVALNRYDLWPAMLVSLSVAALLAGRAALGGGFLSASFTAKIFSAGAVPIVATRLWRTQGRQGVTRGAVAFAVVATAVYSIFAVTGPGGLAFSYWIQAKRDLHAESLGGSLLLSADTLGMWEARIIAGDPGSLDLDGGVALAVASLTTVVAICALAWIWLTYLKGAESTAFFVVALASTAVAFVAFAKVISPQFLTWLLPLVPLVGGRAGRRATLVLAGAMLLTQLEQLGWEGLGVETWAVWVLLARNALLLLLFALLARELVRCARAGREHPPGSGAG